MERDIYDSKIIPERLVPISVMNTMARLYTPIGQFVYYANTLVYIEELGLLPQFMNKLRYLAHYNHSREDLERADFGTTQCILRRDFALLSFRFDMYGRVSGEYKHQMTGGLIFCDSDNGIGFSSAPTFSTSLGDTVGISTSPAFSTRPGAGKLGWEVRT